MASAIARPERKGEHRVVTFHLGFAVLQGREVTNTYRVVFELKMVIGFGCEAYCASTPGKTVLKKGGQSEYALPGTSVARSRTSSAPIPICWTVL